MAIAFRMDRREEEYIYDLGGKARKSEIIRKIILKMDLRRIG
jgi:hypothetical protein